MFITAAQAKEYVNDESEMGIYKKEMDANYKKMIMSYEEWKKDHKLTISVIDINKRFRTFNQVIIYTLQLSTMKCLTDTKNIDYNKAVDDLLIGHRDHAKHATTSYVRNF